MATESPFPEVHRIIADSDVDGMCAAVVLKKAYPDAEVHLLMLPSYGLVLLMR